jgi:hypothetical protein
MKSRIRQWLVEDLRPSGFKHARLAAFVALPILAACNDTTGPARFVSITPASQTVVLQTVPAGKVLRTSVTLTNTSSFAVTWDACAVTLEKKIEGVIALSDGPTPPWFTVWTKICALLSAEAVAIINAPLQPGQSVTIPIEVPVTTASELQHFDGSPGEYRIHLTLAARMFGSQYRPISHDLSVSDAFSVVAQ